MSEPEIAERSPAVLELEPGTYWWCACGQSKDQPWCDGSHQGTAFSPVEVTIDQKKNYALCRCKRSVKSPFCDGSHKHL